MNPRQIRPKSGRRVLSVLRDDVKECIIELARRYGDKRELVKKLLLRESDKLHYFKSQNIERIFDLIEGDNEIIEAIDAIDYDISQIETRLSNILGVPAKDIFVHLAAEKGETEELIFLRRDIGDSIKLLYKQRELLNDRLMSESRRLKNSIDEISRLGRLKMP